MSRPSRSCRGPGGRRPRRPVTRHDSRPAPAQNASPAYPAPLAGQDVEPDITGVPSQSRRAVPSSPSPSWKTAPPVISASRWAGVATSPGWRSHGRGSNPSCPVSTAPRGRLAVVHPARLGVAAEGVPGDSPEPRGQPVGEGPGDPLRLRVLPSSAARKICSRGPQSWSVDRAVSKPTPQSPGRAAPPSAERERSHRAAGAPRPA